jgi:tetratricopeptide (TPR) repeat protein
LVEIVEAYYNRGVVHGMMGNSYAALEDLNRTLKFQPDYADAYYARGKAWAGLNDRDRAIQDYSEAVRRNPKIAEAYANRGLLYMETKQGISARADFQKAADLFRLRGDSSSYRQMLFFIQQLDR